MGLLDDAIREHLDLKRRRGADPTEVERSEREALGPVRRTPERGPGDDSELHPDAAGVGLDTDGLDSDTDSEAVPPPGAIYDDGLVDPDEPGAAAFAPAAPDEPVAPEPGGAGQAPVEPLPHRLDHSTLPGPVGTDDDESSWSYDDASPAGEPSSGVREDVPPPPPPPPHSADPTRLADDSDHTAEYDVAAAQSSEPGPAEPALGDFKTEDPPVRGAPTHESGPPPEEPEEEDVLEETPEFLQDTPDHDRLWFEQRPPRDFDFDG